MPDSDSDSDADEAKDHEEAEISILQSSITRSGRAVKRRVIQGFNHLQANLKT